MYSNYLVVALKTGDKVLQGTGGIVALPFGSEYSILIKNLNVVKAQIGVEIDGVDVLDGNLLLLEPNSEIELEGFIKGKTAKNKFKFIEKTERISSYRGDHIDDGIIRVEYQFESPGWSIFPYWYHSYNTPSQPYDGYPCYFARFNDTGITVKGSNIDQLFDYGSIGHLAKDKHVMCLKLRGDVISNKAHKKSLPLIQKLVCCVCGEVNKTGHNFCSNCGAFLH